VLRTTEDDGKVEMKLVKGEVRNAVENKIGW
jgi:hypothetical protein